MFSELNNAHQRVAHRSKELERAQRDLTLLEAYHQANAARNSIVRLLGYDPAQREQQEKQQAQARVAYSTGDLGDVPLNPIGLGEKG